MKRLATWLAGLFGHKHGWVLVPGNEWIEV